MPEQARNGKEKVWVDKLKGRPAVIQMHRHKDVVYDKHGCSGHSTKPCRSQ